jgi:hypothetical protein
MEWDIKFKGNVPPGTVENAKGLIYESFPRRVYGDALGLEVGDILFFLDNYTTTSLKLSKELLNFSRTPDFNNPESFTFKQNEQLFCSDVSYLIYSTLSNCCCTMNKVTKYIVYVN